MAIGQTSVTDMAAAAQAGQLADLAEVEARSFVNEESSAEIPFGRMVVQGAADDGCVLMAGASDDIIGVSVWSQAYQLHNEVGDDGVKPGVGLAVAREARIWVEVPATVTPGDDVRVHKTGGTFQTGASAGNTIKLTSGARWLTSTSGAGLAQLEIDMDAVTHTADS